MYQEDFEGRLLGSTWIETYHLCLLKTVGAVASSREALLIPPISCINSDHSHLIENHLRRARYRGIVEVPPDYWLRASVENFVLTVAGTYTQQVTKVRQVIPRTLDLESRSCRQFKVMIVETSLFPWVATIVLTPVKLRGSLKLSLSS